MLDQILKASCQGITLIEEEIGSVSPILTRQIGTYGVAIGKKVCFLTLSEEKSETAQQREMIGIRVGAARDARGSDLVDESAIALKSDSGLLNLEDLEFDLIVFEFFSSHIFDKTDGELIEMLGEMRRLASQGRSFVLTSEGQIISPKANAYIRAIADNIIIIKTELARDKIDRLLYIPKMKGIRPMDKLVKFTLSENGIEIDTREFVG